MPPIWPTLNPGPLVPQILDQGVIDMPEEICTKVVRSPTGYRKGFSIILYEDIANTINGIAF